MLARVGLGFSEEKNNRRSFDSVYRKKRGKLRSATVWIVKGWVDGKAENDIAVSRFPTTATTAAEWRISLVEGSVGAPRELWR